MPNGQQVPAPPQQQAQLVTHDIGSGRPITIFRADPTSPYGRTPVETISTGGTFYSINKEGDLGIYFKTPGEAQAYATTKGTPITSQIGVSDVPSDVYWQQKQAEEARRESSYGGVRTAVALGEAGKPVVGSQLEAKVKFLERGTAQFPSEAQFIKTAEEVGRITPVSTKGVIVTPGFKTGEEQLKAMELTITPPETQKIILPPTPRETTEAFMKRVSVGGELVEPQIFKVREGSIVSQYLYTPGAEFKDVFGGRTPIKPGMLYTRDIFGFTTERPLSEVPAMKQVTQREAEIIKTTETVAGAGLGMGFGEAFTTSSMIRGAKLIQPGDVAAITKSIKSLAPKMPSGLAEFIRSEEAVAPRKRTVTLTQLLERPKAAEEKPVEVVDISKAIIQPRESITEVLKLPEVRKVRTNVLQEMKEQATWRPSYETIAEAEAQKPHVTLMSQAERDIIIARIKASGGLYQKQPTITELKPFSEIKPLTTPISTQKTIAATKDIYAIKSVALPVSLYKSLAIQEPIAITKQIAKQRAILTPVEIGLTRQIPVSRAVTPQTERAVSVSPQISVTEPVMETPTIPKEISRGFETPRPKEPGLPKPVAFPFPDFQVYPTRKKGKKKPKGERIVKLYPVGAAENILASLGMGTKKISKRKSKKK